MFAQIKLGFLIKNVFHYTTVKTAILKNLVKFDMSCLDMEMMTEICL